MPAVLTLPDLSLVYPSRRPAVLVDTMSSGWSASTATLTQNSGTPRLANQAQNHHWVDGDATMFSFKTGFTFDLGETFDGMLVALYDAGATYNPVAGVARTVRLDFGNAGNGTLLQASQVLRHGWNVWFQGRHDYSSSAGNFASSIDRLTLRVGADFDLYSGGVWRNGKPDLATFVWQLDDPKQTGFTEWMDLCEDWGWKLNIMVAKSLVGTAEHVSLADLKAAVGRGHRCYNHTDTHVDNSARSKTDFYNDLKACADYLQDNNLATEEDGFNTAHYYAAPFGAVSVSNLEVLRGDNADGQVYWGARTSASPDLPHPLCDAINPYGMGVGVPVNNVSGAVLTARTNIQKGIGRGAIVRGLMHRVQDDAGAGSQSDATRTTFRQIAHQVRELELAGVLNVSDELTERVKMGAIAQWW